MTPQPLDLDAIEDRAGECNVLEDIHALVAEVRRQRRTAAGTARRIEHMENVMTRIPADVLEQAVRETRQLGGKDWIALEATPHPRKGNDRPWQRKPSS